MLINFRLRFMFLFLIILCVIGVLINLYQKPDIRLCFVDSHPIQLEQDEQQSLNDNYYEWGLEKLEDILLAKVQPKPGKSIFFHETSCPQMQTDVKSTFDKNIKEPIHWNMAKLNARQACAIESSALHNPNSQVFVLFASPRYKFINGSSDSVKMGNEAILEAILSYDNVHLRNINLWTYAANTPISDWLKDGALFKSR